MRIFQNNYVASDPAIHYKKDIIPKSKSKSRLLNYCCSVAATVTERGFDPTTLDSIQKMSKNYLQSMIGKVPVDKNKGLTKSPLGLTLINHCYSTC